MKKLISGIPITILIFLLLSNVKVFAGSIDPSDWTSVLWINENHNSTVPWTLVCSVDSRPVYLENGALQPNIVRKKLYVANVGDFSSSYSVGNLSSFYGDKIVVYKGDYISSSNVISYEEYLNPPTPTPTPSPKWYEEMWDTLSDELGNPAFWFGQWFIDIIDQVFGNDENPSQGPSRLSDSTHIQQVTPAPTPSPIPYSTITVPRTDIITGTTVYETNYYYTNPSGTPIVATSPPTNTPTNNNNGGGSGNSQDYNPVDPYSIPQTTWFTSAEIGDTSYDGINSIMQGFDSIDSVGAEYTDGMSVVEDSMGTLPTSWLLLIGIAAAIPLIAGIISRFLS